MKISDSMVTYIMSDDPAEALQAKETVAAEYARGGRGSIFASRNLTSREKQKAGIPAPSSTPEYQEAVAGFVNPQRVAETPAVQTAAPTNELERLREATDRAEARYDEAFQSYQLAQSQLDQAEAAAYAQQWNTGSEPQPIEVPEPLADADIPAAQAAEDARQAQAAEAETSGMTPAARKAQELVQGVARAMVEQQ